MVFPVDALALKGEIFVNNAWTDISGYIYGDGNNAFTINRGYSDEQKSTRSSSCNFKLSSPSGLFNNRNPLSPYFGLIPRNTPLRVTAGTSDTYLKVSPTGDNSRSFTPSTVALNILGDIDVAVDIEPSSWIPGYTTTLAGKYNPSGDQRGWGFALSAGGFLQLYWSTDGTVANRQVRTSSIALPSPTARMSVRVFLDVNNGASGHNVQFFYSSTGITGPWTQLGTTITTAGVTSIASTTETVSVGGLAGQQSLVGGGGNFSGRIYKFLLKNSAGTIVSNLDFTSVESATTSLTDAQGNVWTNGGSARLRNDSVRFVGEISKFPYETDKTNTEVYSNITASGILRRLTQGASPLRSPLFRRINNYNPFGYFPMEDNDKTTILSNEAANGQPGTVTGVSFVGDETLPGTGGVMNIDEQTAVVKGNFNTVPNGNYYSASWFMRMGAIPPSETLIARFFAPSGVIRRWDIVATLTAFRVDAYNAAGTIVSTGNVVYSGVGVPTNWISFQLEATQVGGNVQWAMYCVRFGDTLSYFTGIQTVAGTVGRLSSFEIRAQTNLVDTKYTHLMVSQTKVATVNYEYYAATAGYAGETAGNRIKRLSEEEKVNFLWFGNLDDTELMGPQTVDTFVNLIEEAKAVDDGFFIEPQDQLGIEYITRSALISRFTEATLSYSGGHLSGEFLPVDDDLRLRNDVTVTRTSGGSARAEPLEGPSLPSIVGRYQESVTLNAANDSQLEGLAGWRAFLGTWDEPRYEQIQVQLSRPQYAASTTLSNSVVRINIAGVGLITDVPVYQSANDVRFLILGYEERLGQYQWDIRWNAAPYGTYEANTLRDRTSVRPADATDSKLVSGINSSVTSFTVTATTDPVWTLTELPVDIRIGGEVMTVTAVSGTSFPQTFTVTRSINGVVKSHLANAPVFLAQPFYTTL